MSIDGWRPTAGAVTDRRRDLERDWRRVLAGAAIVAPMSAFEPQSPR
ncbi:hypothetical protein Htur_3182 [Haloterrigena turkmenica DSM 5511]|uniref:Uncharacterized protein n=1 Tax=Haloterrigena turkmenica (strain ATCC 51198 / DSM 5511 / JCM 9101 / NCIMB 13204 / VKM B-1734 / 4k) TaxID=543526 RepID=D2RZK8_HALTV|nr:hypothetical protein [Haloterrigena turkmenica]ADB62047.1 hypothetical protein Htur_3182 [Haloterrigena turkmenica DSM 5511]